MPRLSNLLRSMRFEWLTLGLILALLATGWGVIFNYIKAFETRTIQEIQAKQMEVAQATGRGIQAAVEAGLRTSKDLVGLEQEAYTTFIAPQQDQRSGFAWLYTPRQAVFALAPDFPPAYRQLTIEAIFTQQSQAGAADYHELLAGLQNRRAGASVYTWSEAGGQQVAAWTAFQAGNETWLVGTSTPLGVIRNLNGVNGLKWFALSVIAAASFISLGIAFLIINQAVARRRHEAELKSLNIALEQHVAERTNELSTANQELRSEVARREEAEEALEQRALALTGLHQTSLAINSQLDLNTLLPAIVERAAALLGARMGGLYMIQADQASLRLVVSHNLPAGYLGATLRLGEGLAGQVAQSGELMMVEDYQTWEGRDEMYPSGAFRRVLAVPLKANKRVLGVLNVTDDQRSGWYNSDEIRLASLFADQAALAIEKAQLFETAQRDLQERRRYELELRTSEERFKHISQSMSDFAYSCLRSPRQEFVLDWMSGAVEAITGYSVEEVQAQLSWGFLVIEEDQSIFREKVIGLQPGDSSVCELRIQRKDGALRWLMAFNKCVYEADAPEKTRLFGGCRDISERKAMEDDLRSRQHYLEQLNEITQAAIQTDELDEMLQMLAERMGTMMKADGCYITLWDAENKRTIPAAAFGPLREDELQQPEDEQEKTLTTSVLGLRQTLAVEDVFNTPYISPSIAARFPSRSMLGLPLTANNQLLGAALISYHANHNFSPGEVALGEQAAGQIALAVYKARLVEELQRLAIVDELTGVYNFRGLMELGRREVERAQRFGRPLAMLFFDIDHFRAFNNRYSHSVGNVVLRSVAQQTLAHVRSVDLVTRYGGEEFVVLIPETELEPAVKIAERLRQAVETNRVQTQYGALAVTISLGVADFTVEVLDLDTLIDRANRAEHRAKEQGRNRVVAYDPLRTKPRPKDEQNGTPNT